MKLVFVTVSSPAVRSLIEASKKIDKILPAALDLCIYHASNELPDDTLKHMIGDITTGDMTFVDLMGSSPEVVAAVNKGLEKTAGDIIPIGNSARERMKLGRFTAELMRKQAEKQSGAGAMGSPMERVRSSMKEPMAPGIPAKMVPPHVKDMQNYSAIGKYFRAADKDNIYSMLLLLMREYGGLKDKLPEPKPPMEIPDIAYCDPGKRVFFKTFGEYAKDHSFNHDSAVIVMLFSGHSYPSDTFGCVTQIKNKLDRLGNVIPIALSVSTSETIELLDTMLTTELPKPPDVILNFKSFRFSAGPAGGDADAGTQLLSKIDAPYLHPFFMTRRSQKEWAESIQGCSSSEVMISVMLPELDGCTVTIPVGAATEPKYNADYDIFTEEIEVIDERLRHLEKRVENLLVLKCKENKTKRVAIICYNYPPGEDNLFGGAFLDTFESVSAITYRLSAEGYDIPPMSAEELMGIFRSGGIVNSGKFGDNADAMIRMSAKNYAADKAVLSPWGKPPGEIMSDGNDFLIPGTIKGNIFIGLQPGRMGEQFGASRTTSPGRMGEQFGANRTTSPGRMAQGSTHDKTLTPHHQYMAFYQWVANEFKADAIIHVGTHGTLEFLPGKECGMSETCYPDKLLYDLPHIYLYFCGNPSEATIAKRRSHAALVGYQPPVFIPGGLYGEYLSLSTEIDNYRQAMAISPATLDSTMSKIMELATKLNLPEDIEIIESELYRMSTGLIPKGLHIFGQGYSEEERQQYAMGLARYGRDGHKALQELVGASADAACDKGDKIFEYYVNHGRLPEGIQEDAASEIIEVIENAISLSKSATANHEMDGLIRSLEGRYNPAKLAGDIYRSPEVLPAGSNLYQFDPRLVPSSTAMERGRRICDNTLERYKAEFGHYPESVAVVLWGLETSRTQGETLGQILAYLGVRIDGNTSPWEKKFEIIPREELRRPRIDCTVNICGFFRDMFPNIITLLDDIFVSIAELDEPDNHFRKHSEKFYTKLLNEGQDTALARQLSNSRIFGPREGEYGTGLTGIIEGKEWQSENELGNVFTNNARHIYNRNMRGVHAEGLYEENLKNVDIVSQVRSSHEYEITDLDHYYEYFGGLAKSVEMAKGSKAHMLITDTTGERIETDKAETAIARGIRARVLNPKWIDGMLEHKYHGVQKIAERFENLMGLAATTGAVDEWIYDNLYEKYVEDEEICRRMKENNPFAYMKILEQMAEYNARGYWDTSPEALAKIKETYFELEGEAEAGQK